MNSCERYAYRRGWPPRRTAVFSRKYNGKLWHLSVSCRGFAGPARSGPRMLISIVALRGRRQLRFSFEAGTVDVKQYARGVIGLEVMGPEVEGFIQEYAKLWLRWMKRRKRR